MEARYTELAEVRQTDATFEKSFGSWVETLVEDVAVARVRLASDKDFIQLQGAVLKRGTIRV